MTWAMRRRFIILGIIAAVVFVALGVLYFTLFHQAPSCTDQKQNQDEEGIDCGGSCVYFCTVSQAAPAVRFVRPLMPVPGRTDVVAYVDNPNGNAAANDLHYTVELYSPTNTIVGKQEGTVDLPPSSSVPIFIPDFYSGYEAVARAFITFDTPDQLWFRYRDARILPRVSAVQYGELDMPRVRALAENPSESPMKNVLFIVTLFDREGTAIAASRTIAPAIAPHETVELVFTWPASFPGTVSRIEVVPVIPLPIRTPTAP
jgi:hypothetical protein